MNPALAMLAGFVAFSARGQVDPSTQVVTCDYHDTNIHRLLSDLFKKLPISFSMDEKIQGNVSAHLPPMQFEAALKEILASCYLTYRSGGGVIQILQSERTAEEQKWIDAHPSSEIQTTGLPDDLAPATKGKHERASEVLWRILSKSGKAFVIGMGLDARVTVDVPAQSLAETLGLVAYAAHGAMSHKASVWILSGPFRGSISSDASSSLALSTAALTPLLHRG